MSRGQTVSVVIPTYNRARKCLAAVESVLAQSHQDVEVLVIDDGSTDGTRELISGIDRRVRYLSQQNAGVTVARNTGLRAASGDFVAFLDSDDTWMPWKLEAQLAVMRGFPDVGMTWTDMSAVDEDGNLLHRTYIRRMYKAYDTVDTRDVLPVRVPLSEVWSECPAELAAAMIYVGDLFDAMFLGNMVHTSTALLTRERQRETGHFDETLTKTGEDYDFHLRTCAVGPVAMLDIPSIHYQIGASDQLTSPALARWMAINNLKTIEKVWYSDRRPVETSRRRVRKRFSDAHLWIAREAFWAKPREARVHLCNSIRWWPLQATAWCYSLLTLLPTSWSRQLRRLKQRFA